MSCPPNKFPWRVFQTSTLVLLAVALVGCRPETGPEWLVGDIECAATGSPVSDVSLSWEATTWPVLDIELDAEVEGWVRFGTSEDPLRSSPREQWSGSVSVPLRGGRAERLYEYVIVTGDGESRWCEFGTFETGSFDADFPDLNTTVFDAERVPNRYILLPVYGETEKSFTVILDEGGQPVWVAEESQTSPSVQMYDGMLWKMAPAIDEESYAKVVGRGFDLTVNYEVRVQGLRFTFDIDPLETQSDLSGNTLWSALAWDFREIEHEGETRHVVGDRVIEFNLNGETQEVWSAFDTFTPDLSEEWPMDSGFYPDPDGEDWSHVNSLSYDRDEDAYFVPSDGLEAIIRVDRSTGLADWVLSDSFGDFEILGDAHLIDSPHSVQWLGDDRLLVFNRNLEGGTERCATVDEIALDLDGQTAELIGRYGEEECLTVAFLGEAIQDDAGRRWITYGSAGRFEVLDADGTLIVQSQLDLGGAFGFHEVYDSLYRTDTRGPDSESL